MKDRISDNMYNMLISVSSLLSDIVKNSRIQLEHINHNMFQSLELVNIPIDNYFDRLVRYSNIEESTIILMLIYIDRLCEYNNITLIMENLHS